jgi:hypothetical protein
LQQVASFVQDTQVVFATVNQITEQNDASTRTANPVKELVEQTGTSMNVTDGENVAFFNNVVIVKH